MFCYSIDVAKAVVSTFLFFHDESDIFVLLCMIVDSMSIWL